MEKPTILKKILQRKQEEVIERKKLRSLSELEEIILGLDGLRGFTRALAQQIARKRPAVIAEIKKASPSKGLLREDFQPESIAQSYAEAGQKTKAVSLYKKAIAKTEKIIENLKNFNMIILFKVRNFCD